MNKMWKRSLSLFLAIVMILGVVPMGVFAEEQECAHANVEYIDEAATCTWNGYYAEYCNDCEQYLVEELLDPVGHDFVDGVCTACGEAEAVEPEADETEESEEISEEPVSVEDTTIEAPVAYAATRVENGVTLYGNNIWLDGARNDELVDYVMEDYVLKPMVLDALGVDGDTVYFVNDKDGKKYDVADFWDLVTASDILKEQLTSNSSTRNLHFQVVKNGVMIKDEIVTMRNIDNLVFTITVAPVENKGPFADAEDLKEAVKAALENATIVATYGDVVIDLEASKKLLTIDVDNIPDNIAEQWPALGESATSGAYIEVTLRDSVSLGEFEEEYKPSTNTKKCYVELVDTTKVYTVNFNTENGLWQQFKVAEEDTLAEQGMTLETLVPEREYYTFDGWCVIDGETETVVADPFNIEMDDTVTGEDRVITYTAKWNALPEYDSNGNNICDFEDFFTVRYLEENGSTVKQYTQRYGTYTNVPENPANKVVDGTTYKFTGWRLKDADGKIIPDSTVSEFVTKDVVYYATWADATEITVSYTKKFADGGFEQFELPLKADGTAEFFDYDDKNTTVKEWDGWYIEGTDTKWDFTKAVTAADATNYVLSLVGTLGYDDNEDGFIDGTEKDPIVEYYFQHKIFDEKQQKDVWVNYLSERTVHLNEEAELDIAAFSAIEENSYADTLSDNRKWDCWVTNDEIPTGGTQYYVKKYYKPSFVPDVNNNTVADTKEAAKLLNAGELNKNGVFETEEGSITIPGLQAGGTFLANSTATGDPTVITAKANTGYYVDKILVNGNEQTLTEGANGVSIKLHNATKKDANPAYEVEVVFKAIAVEFKATPDAGVLIPGKQYTEADVIDVYKAVAASPEYKDSAKVEVNYVARPESNGKVTVDISNLRKDLEARYGKVAKELLKDVWPGDTVSVELGEVVKPISYPHDGMVMTPQQVVDNYILELQTADFKELTVALGMLERKVQAKVEAYANIRPFMYNAAGTSFEETLIVSYEDNRLDIDDSRMEAPYTLADGRGATKIVIETGTVNNAGVPVLNVEADKYNENTLKAIAGLYDSNGMELQNEEIHLVGNFDNCTARMYEGVPFYFAGSVDYKPSVGTFNLNVGKSDLSITMKQAIAVPYNDHSYVADAKPTIEVDGNVVNNVEYISVVAGLDLNNLNLDLAQNKPFVNVRDLGAKAWIHIPENLREILDLVGINLEGKKSRTLDQIETMFQENRALLESFGAPGWAIDKMLAVLNKVNAYASGNVEMEIFFVDTLEDAYPTKPGVYANVAITTDPGYETAFAYGGILIAPVLALPDRGDVNLTFNGKNENVFILPNTLTHKDLVVTYQGNPLTGDEAERAPIYYYGMTSKFEMVEGIGNRDEKGNYKAGENVPINPGVYLASTLYTKDNNGNLERMGSDVAIVVIGLADIEIDVATDIIPADNQPHRPEITVKTTKANGDVEIKPIEETDVALTLISGEVQVDRDGDIGLDDLSADVNIDFPERIYNEWPNFKSILENQTKIDISDLKLEDDLKDAVLNPAALREFLEWCKDQNTGRLSGENLSQKVTLLESLIPEEYYKPVETYYNKTLDKMIEYCGDLQTAANKLPDKIMRITFDPAKTDKTEEGIYFYFGIVTDPDYIPYANGGVMVLEGETNMLLDTHTPYNGQGQAPAGWEDMEEKNVTVVVNREANTLNIISDPSINALIDEAIDELEDLAAKFNIKQEVGKKNWLDGKTIGQLQVQVQENGTKLIDMVTSKICGVIEKKLIEKIPSDTAQTELDKLTAAIEERVAKMNGDLDAKLANLKVDNADMLVTVNASLPVNEGTYEFYSFSEKVTISRADLIIEPIFVSVEASSDAEKAYDGKPVDDLTPYISIRYYSYAYTEGTEREAGRKYYDTTNPLPADIAGKVDVDPDAVFNEKWINVGKYPIDITGATVTYAASEDAKKNNVSTTAELIDGSLTITPRPVTVTTESASKFYGNEEPETFDYKAEGLMEGNKLVIEVVRENKSEDVGVYPLTVSVITEDPNYTVVLANYSNFTIKPAEIKLIGETTTKGFDQPDEPYGFDYEIINGFGVINGVGEYDKDVVDKELDNDHLNVTVERARDEQDDVGDVFTIYVNHKNNDKTENGALNEANDYPNIKVLETTNGTLTIDYGDYVCWDMKDTYYSDLSDALDMVDDDGATQYGYETIQMLKDTTETYVVVASGTTLDLNGHTVTARFVSAFEDADIIDRTRQGLLKVDMNNVYLDKTNRMIPIWNAKDGYMFTQVQIIDNQATVGLTKDDVAGTAMLKFVTIFRDSALLLDGADDNDLSVEIVANWKPKDKEDGNPYQHFVYGNEQVGLVVQDQGSTAYKLVVTDYANFADLTLTAKVISGTGVEFAGQVFEVN